MKSVAKFLKFMGVWIVLFFLFLFAFASVDAFTEEVTDQSSVSVNYSGSETTNEETNSTTSDDTVSVSVTNRQVKGEFALLSIFLSFLCTSGIFVGADNNKAQHLKASIPSLQKDVVALEERREHQLDQANRVLDKYLNHKNSLVQKKENQLEENSDLIGMKKVKNGKEFHSIIAQYPTLQGNDAVNSLMHQIQQVESLLSNKKQQLNQTIASYNGTINSFPLSIFKKISKLEEYRYEDTIPSGLEEAISDDELGI